MGRSDPAIVPEHLWRDDDAQRTVGLPSSLPLREELGGPPPWPTQDLGNGAPTGAGEVLYMWRDGEDTRPVWLQNGLVVQPSSENEPEDVVLFSTGSESIVFRSAKHDVRPAGPVFRSEGGILMTLPGGVILVLEETWDSLRVDRFFREQGIAEGRAAPMDFAPNAFLVATEPGFPSLTLANSLAEVEGTVIAIPNWSSELVLQ